MLKNLSCQRYSGVIKSPITLLPSAAGKTSDIQRTRCWCLPKSFLCTYLGKISHACEKSSLISVWTTFSIDKNEQKKKVKLRINFSDHWEHVSPLPKESVSGVKITETIFWSIFKKDPLCPILEGAINEDHSNRKILCYRMCFFDQK